MNEDKKPLIIVLSGAYGVGKTTLAHQLSVDLHVTQRITITSIVKTARAMFPNNRVFKNWYVRSNTDIKFLKSKLRRESKLAGKIVKTIVDSSFYTGENYVIDGVQLLPEFLPMDRIIFFHVTVSDKEKHKKMFKKPHTTRLRRTTEIPYSLSHRINKLIAEECKGYSIYQIDNIESPKQASRKIIKIIKKGHPDYRERYLWFAK